MEEEQPQQVGQNYSEEVRDTVSYPIQDNSSENMIKYQLDNSDDIIALEFDLRGYEFDPVKRVFYLPNPSEPIVSDYGRKHIMGILRQFASKMSWMGGTKADAEMHDIHTDVMFSIINLFQEHGLKCGFKSISECDLLRQRISNLVWASLTRTRDGGERAGLRDTVRTTQQLQVTGNKKMGLRERFRRMKY